ncbi:MAG: hypothetical protein GXP48_09115 [Acidobacteria bacterium]|nr:hypothetical protein [Acidobacteriota bacterium]
MKRIACLILAIAAAGNLAATQTKRWTVDTASQLLKGTGDGVAVTLDGRLIPVPGWKETATLGAPVVLAGVVAPDGAVLVGTGHPAGLFELRGGTLKKLAKVPADQVTAMTVAPDGRIFLATTGPAAVFEWNGKKLRKAGGIEGGGFWDMAWFDGSLIVAAGSPATLYRLKPQGLERWLELPDRHARCLAPDGKLLLVGTSGRGLVLRVDAKGTIGLVADSAFTEISSLLVAPDGTIWAAAVVGAPAAPASSTAGSGAKSKGKATVTVSSIKLKLPKVNGTTASSELLRLTSTGAVLSVHRFAGQVVTTLGWDGSGVLAGTGYEGEIWRFTAKGGTRMANLDAVQVTRILAGGRFLLTQGPPAILSRKPAGEGGGTFRSAVEKFRRPVAFGRFRVDPPVKGVRIRFRSGLTSRPDLTWLPWTGWLDAAGGEVGLPPATSLQWEIAIPASKTPIAVERIGVAYREINLAPKIKSITVDEPGVVYLAAPPPTGQYIDVSHPDFNGIFTTLTTGGAGSHMTSRGKKYWRVGYRTVGWQATDPNGDPLRFSISLERRDGFVLPVRTRFDKTHIAVDTTAIPDGWYRFKIAATDAADNPAHPLSTSDVSSWFTVDNTPPRVTITRKGSRWRVEADDALSAIELAQWSRDGKRWHALAPADGILDGRHETFSFPAKAGHHLVVVRVFDRHHNRAVASAVEK